MKRNFCSSAALFCAPLTETCLQWPLKPGLTFSHQLHEIEKHWKEPVENAWRLNRASTNLNDGSSAPRKSKYVLAMFPYPSGNLHMGHLRVYTISDVMSRFYILKGFRVIHPIGWDAFGLPAENAAIQRGVDPETWTYSNIETMRGQLLRTGIHFDWERELFTCKSDYFKWTQWIFLQLYKHGLVRRTMSEVFWDPIDETVLAAEQVDKDGHSWRSGALVQKQKRRQWAIETPKFAKRLLKGLEDLKDHWAGVTGIQAGWIGKCDVFRFLLPIKNEGPSDKQEDIFDLRISNPVDLISAQFCVVTPEHSLADKNSTHDGNYVLEGVRVFNFLNGIEMPVVVSSKRPHGVKIFLNARIGNPKGNSWDQEISKEFNLCSETIPEMIMSVEQIQQLAEISNYGGYETSRKLLDWVVSRQRSWGTPIPMVLDETGKCALPIPENQLPLLSELRGQKIEAKGFPSGFGIVETDTLDTSFDSSWYFLRYLDPRNANEMVDQQIAAREMPIDIYVGGIEHADVHLFFARFISYFLYDLGILAHPEPVKKLIPQGYVLGKTFVLQGSGAFIEKNDVEEIKEIGASESTFVQKYTGRPVTLTYDKMSKSKMNGVDPLEVIESNGIDMARLLLIYAAVPHSEMTWGRSQDSDIFALSKLLNRLAKLIGLYIESRTKLGDSFRPLRSNTEEKFKMDYDKYMKEITDSIEVTHAHKNTIANMQILSLLVAEEGQEIIGRSAELEKCIHALVIVLQIFAPHVAAEMWTALSKAPKIQKDLWDPHAPVSQQAWPTFDGKPKKKKKKLVRVKEEKHG